MAGYSNSTTTASGIETSTALHILVGVLASTLRSIKYLPSIPAVKALHLFLLLFCSRSNLGAFVCLGLDLEVHKRSIEPLDLDCLVDGFTGLDVHSDLIQHIIQVIDVLHRSSYSNGHSNGTSPPKFTRSLIFFRMPLTHFSGLIDIWLTQV